MVDAMQYVPGEEYEAMEIEEEEEEEEDDPVLQQDLKRLLEEEEMQPKDPDAYKPQLMDEMEMRALRRELRTSEARLESDGHMREFAPRKPTQSMVWTARRVSTGRPGGGKVSRPVTRNALPNQGDLEAVDEHQDPFTTLDIMEGAANKPRIQYSQALRDEVLQLSELQDKYEETKRLLLEQLDHVCTTKPSERTSSNNTGSSVDEAYEKLDELLAFAAKCAV